MIDLKHPKSMPLGFWTEQDIWLYIKKYNLTYSKIYDMGYDRTGCMYCMFGVHLEEPPNRFQLMAQTHPKRYRFCMRPLGGGGCGIKDVLGFMNIPYEPFTQTALHEFSEGRPTYKKTEEKKE